MRHDWPGNVRELQNCVGTMAAMNPGPDLRLEDLPSACPVFANRLSDMPDPGALGRSRAERKPIIPLEEVERRAILDGLDQTKGDRALPPRSSESAAPRCTAS